MATINKNEDNNVMWRTLFMAIILAIVTMIISISIFFYIRTRESVWDNRSGTSRLIAINQTYSKDLGIESFTMYGTTDITINGELISDSNTLYIADGGIIYVELTGMSRGETSGTVDSYKSRLLVNRKGGNVLQPLDPSASSVSPTVIDISPIAGSAGTLQVSLVGSRLEIRGVWISAPPETRSHALKIETTGWYP